MANDTSVVPSTSAASIFSAYEQDRLDNIQRFLVRITDSDLARRAACVGYDADEHRVGWKLWSTAVGMDVPFDEHVASVKERMTSLPNGQSTERIRELDSIENTWFPRARNAIRRFVSPEVRTTFEAAFFEDMQQQPEGPGVVGSVEKLIGRIEALHTSKVSGAKAAYEALAKKGWTKTLVKNARALVQESKEVDQFLSAKAPTVTSADARRKAYDDSNLWYIDWADTLREELSHMQGIRLGVASRAARRSEELDGSPEGNVERTSPAVAQPGKPVA